MNQGEATLEQIQDSVEGWTSRPEGSIKAILVLGSGITDDTVIAGLRRRFFNKSFDVTVIHQDEEPLQLVDTEDGFPIPRPDVMEQASFVDVAVLKRGKKAIRYLNVSKNEALARLPINAE